MKKIFIASVLLISSQGSINAGQGLSYFYRSNPIDQIKQELKTYLEKLDLKSFKNRSQLEKNLQNILNKNMREDNTNFPIFIAFINQPDFETDKNIALREQVINSINNVLIEFVNKKCTELGLPDKN